MCECKCCNMSENEYIDIINDLIYEYAKLLGKKYERYFVICDCDVTDNFLSIYVDCFNKYGFRTEEEYVEYLSVFYKKCEKFVALLNDKLPKNVKMSEWYQRYDVEDEKIRGNYYESCIMEFRIRGDLYD